MYIRKEENHLVVKQDKPPKKITGTRLAAILGRNPYATPFQVWCDITHTYEEPYTETIYTRAGKVIEPLQAEYVKQLYPDLVKPAEIYGDDYFNTTHGNFFMDEVFGGMWDYLLVNKDTNETYLVFEMKTTGEKNRRNWSGVIPEYYQLQAALYAHLLHVDSVCVVVTFLKKEDYDFPEGIVLTPENTITISFSMKDTYPQFESTYIQPARQWYNDYVLSGISPEITTKDHEILSKLEFTEDDMNTKDNSERITGILNKLQSNVEDFDSIIDNIVNSYTISLDDVMKNVYTDIVIPLQNNQEISIDSIERYFLELSNTIYFVGEKVEKLGMYDAIGKISYKEAFNEKYMNPQLDKQKPTVAELTAYAEGESVYDQTVSEMYSRAYKLCKQKLDNANTMISTLSKTISRRMSEIQQVNFQENTRKLLNEEAIY